MSNNTCIDVNSKEYKQKFVKTILTKCDDIEIAMMEFEAHHEDIDKDDKLDPEAEALECMSYWI